MSMPTSVSGPVFLCGFVERGVGAKRSTHVNLAILEPLLQVVVDGLIRDLANQREI